MDDFAYRVFPTALCLFWLFFIIIIFHHEILPDIISRGLQRKSYIYMYVGLFRRMANEEQFKDILFHMSRVPELSYSN